MTASITIRCDQWECDAYIPTDTVYLAAARAHAIKLGWHCGPNGDRCPTHRRR